MFKKHRTKNSIMLKSVLALGIISSGTFGINAKVDAATQNVSSEQKESEQSLVKKLYDRYSKDKINGKSNTLNNWVISNKPLQENQVRLNFEGTYKYAGETYKPKRNITLNKETITLKELDHIVRFAHISYGLYTGEHLPQGNIVINRNDGDKYTLEVHKELQSHRENVKINTADLKNITFDLTENPNSDK
ncbi:TPA: toxin [Staphylococcus aureus]|nr:toxin [Staphylococcus aureus]HDD0305893.1 toxin [Staphylococcus aureus]HDD0308096.1 toxin [Staphylococcus aureus]HDD0311559.1 toxin [Staphylococcus aureus]HDD0314258.1 toxin [Staphylococcus aureus]